MATVSNPSGQRAQAMRDAWLTARGHAAGIFGHVFAFFTAFPPLAQGLYYLLTGLWPLLAADSYQRLSGHHGDPGLVAGQGVLLLVVGGALCLAAYRRQGSPEVLFLAFGSALGMITLDLFLVFNRGLSSLYLLDAAIEGGLLVFWVYGWGRARREAKRAAAPLAAVVPGP